MGEEAGLQVCDYYVCVTLLALIYINAVHIWLESTFTFDYLIIIINDHLFPQLKITNDGDRDVDAFFEMH